MRYVSINHILLVLVVVVVVVRIRILPLPLLLHQHGHLIVSGMIVVNNKISFIQYVNQ